MKPSDNGPWNVTNTQVRKCKSKGGGIETMLIEFLLKAGSLGLE